MKPIVLIVEDEKEISNGITLYLRHQGLDVYQAFNGAQSLEAFSSYHPNVILLDRLLPDIEGCELCQYFKSVSNVGVIFMTALASRDNELEGFSCGADDYIRKPFDMQVLYSRINALNKRLVDNLNLAEKESFITLNTLCFDIIRNDVIHENIYASLTLTEYRLLKYIVSKKGYSSDEELLKVLYGKNYSVSTRTLSVHIANIRKKLIHIKRDDLTIIKKYKRGYKLYKERVEYE